MQFTSLLFIFVFLPFSAILYCILPFKWWRNAILLLSSLFFYAWGEPLYVFLLIFLVIMNWILGVLIEKSIQNNKPGKANIIRILAIILNLLPLIFLKLLGSQYFSDLPAINIFKDIKGLSFPIGLSFFTFTSISYIIDVYRKDVKAEQNIFKFANYLLMFPKILQGPITRFEQVGFSLNNPVINVDNIARGLRRFITGLAKKVLVADYIAAVSNKVFSLNPDTLNPKIAWYGLAAFTLQIFLDFSGYTDMAIGLGNIFGFELPENFNFPYISRNITEFWRRWHMTLSGWFRTYLFIPLEISRRREKFFRQQTNLLIVFLATGLWHGITINYILWGLYFGIILAIESSFLLKWLNKLHPFFQHAYALSLITFGWVLFRLEKVSSWVPFFKSLTGFNNSNTHSLRSLNILLYYPLMIIGVLMCVPLLNNFSRRYQDNILVRSLSDILLAGLFILCISVIASGNYQAFLYADF